MSELSDEELMALYQKGELVAFEQIYKRYSSRLYGFLLKKTNGHSSMSQELLQESFFRLHAQRHKYNSSYPFLPWLFTLCRNLLLDELKTAESRRQKVTQSLDPSFESGDNSWTPLTEAYLQEAWQGLPKNQQRALELRYLEDWSFEDIATQMSSQPQSVRQWVSRGLRRLRQSFEPGESS